MGARRQARENALMMLYQFEFGGEDDGRLAGSGMLGEVTPDVEGFAADIVRGVRENIAEIDSIIAAHSTNWKLTRMAAVDKNILRMAVFELKHHPEIPAKVTINEAVEIAKKYGSSESGAFVNGILDHVAQEERKG